MSVYMRCSHTSKKIIKNEQDAIELWNHRMEVTDNN